MLSRLFGTQLYDRITAELERRRGEAARARQVAQDSIQTAVSAAAEAAGLDASTRDEMLGLTRAERDIRLKQTAEDLAATAEVTGAGLEVATAGVAAARSASERAKQQASLMARLTQALARLRAHEAPAGARPAGPAARPGPPRRARPAAAAGAHRGRAARPMPAPSWTLVPEPGEDMLAGRGGADAAARAEAAELTAAAAAHLADDEAALPGREAALAGLRQAVEARPGRGAGGSPRELPGQIGAVEGNWPPPAWWPPGSWRVARRKSSRRSERRWPTSPGSGRCWPAPARTCGMRWTFTRPWSTCIRAWSRRG